MKTDYRIDYKAQTAAHYTHFVPTEESERIIGRNVRQIRSIADQATSTINSRAVQKMHASLVGSRIDTFA